MRFWGPNVDADIDDELRYHLEMRVGDFITEGLTPERAREEALRRFGDPGAVARTLRAHDKRKLRHERRADMMQDLIQDVRYGARKLAQAPRFTAAVAIVLALGIGANTAVFSAIDAAFFRPLPFFEPQSIVAIKNVQFRVNRGTAARVPPKYAPEMSDLRAERDVFTQVAAYATGGLNLAGGAEPVRATVTFVSADFFSLLGRMPLIGRPFTGDETSPGGPHAVILAYALWQHQFGGDRSALQRRVTLNDASYTIVGVMPPDFTFPTKPDLWIAMAVPPDRSIMAAFRSYLPSTFIARLAAGSSPAAARQRLDALGVRYRLANRRSDTPISELATPLHVALVGDRKTALFVLMGSAILLLMIACANVTNLLLSRATTRRREIAVRVVLGATRARVIRQLTVESVLLALLGGVLSVVVAWLFVGALAGALPAGLAAVAPPRVDARVLVFTMLLALATSLFFGLWPAIGSSRVNLHDAIKAGGGTATRLRGRGARGVLVVAEVALALMLVVGAGLLVESLHSLLTVDSGIRTERLATTRLTLSSTKYPTPVATSAFLSDVLRRVDGAHGVEAAGAVNALPMDQEGAVGLRVTPEDAPDDEQRGTFATHLSATPGYFRALGTPMRGDDLPATFDSTRRVAVVNQALAKKLWPGIDPIGKRLLSPAGGAHTVIGVVADIRTDALDETAAAQVYFPMAEAPRDFVSIVARGSGDMGALIAGIREAVRSVDASQPVYAAASMDDVVSASVAPRRTNTILLSTFGLLALLLAAIGVYAVLAYGIAQRTREIGVRVALGAQASDVVRLIMAQGVGLAVVGTVIGLAAAYALARFLSSILYDVGIHDPRVFLGAPVLLLGVALLATWLPARRAARVTPMEALREV